MRREYWGFALWNSFLIYLSIKRLSEAVIPLLPFTEYRNSNPFSHNTLLIWANLLVLDAFKVVLSRPIPSFFSQSETRLTNVKVEKKVKDSDSKWVSLIFLFFEPLSDLSPVKLIKDIKEGQIRYSVRPFLAVTSNLHSIPLKLCRILQLLLTCIAPSPH